ncbi:PAS domain S-box protein [Longimicrobium sp.]|jgi:PAS domain S-box-containing protein|uniref:PAS domain S-box protein n=1 Tax=Longimicrobium sp. TaxID=2029185 RepID=UPI002F95B717
MTGPSRAAREDALRDPERLTALRQADLLDTLPEASFDRLARLAGRLLHAPLAQVNLVDDRRQFSKSSIAPATWSGGREAPLHDSFCQYTIRTREPFVVEDARVHPLVSGSAAVREHGLIAYAGVPLLSPDGFALGTLCVGDFAPRRWTEEELQVLSDLADAVSTEVELRREVRRREQARDEAAESRRLLSTLLEHIPGAAYRCRNEPHWPVELVSMGVAELTGYPPEAFTEGKVTFGQLIHPDDRGQVWNAVQEAVAAPRPFRLEYRVRDWTGAERWVWEQGEGVFSADGELLALEGLILDVTDRKQGEFELARNAATLQGVLDASPDVIELLDLEGRFRWVSPASREVLGYATHEMEGRPLLELLHPEDRDEVAAGLAALGSGTRDDFNLRYRVQHRTGEWVVLDTRARLVRDRGFDGFVLVARDVTAQQEMERRLVESEELYRRLFETNPFPMWLVDPERFAFVDANRAAVQAYGYSRAEFLGMSVRDLRPAEEIQRLETVITATCQEAAGQRTETRHTTKPGGVRDVEVHTQPITVDGRKLVIAVAHDVTERRKAETALRETNEFLQSILESTPDVVFVKDLAGRYRLTNSAGLALLGRPAAEVIGKTDGELYPDEVVRAFRAADSETVSTGRVVTSEQTIGTPAGTRSFEATEVPQRDGEGRIIGVIGIARDVTAAKAAFEALRAAKVEAERANLAKSEFLSRMSHELRTPMNAILGFAQLLELEVETDENRESVQQILHAGRHLLRLIDEVLDLASIEAERVTLTLEPVRLTEVLRQSLALVRSMGENRRVTFHEGPGCDAAVLADEQRLKQVLLNLLSNGVKYNREGGSVTVSCREAAGGRLRILVADTGPGIAPELQGRLFRAFERLDSGRTDVPGTGLGLSLSKGLVQAMGGEIGVESAVGEGSTFWVELPRATEDGGRAAGGGGAPEVRTVLYIEDNRSNVRLVERVLAGRGDLELVAAGEGREGLELARRLKPGLVLLDVHLPDMDGEQVLAELRADPELRATPVVVISADATPGRVQRLLDAGALDYLTKPFDVRRLLAAIENALDHAGPGR